MHTELSAVVTLAGGVVSVLGPSKGASVVGVVLFALGTVLGVAAVAGFVCSGAKSGTDADAADASDDATGDSP
ncbi:MAG: hypothetical protein ABEH81_09150 [Halopenitus sp.]